MSHGAWTANARRSRRVGLTRCVGMVAPGGPADATGWIFTERLRPPRNAIHASDDVVGESHYVGQEVSWLVGSTARATRPREAEASRGRITRANEPTSQ